ADGLEHGLAHRPRTGPLKDRGNGGGTGQEIDVESVVGIAEAVDVAGLAGGRFPDARQLGTQTDGRGHDRTRYSWARKRSCSAARSTPLTGARARQPGTALTSIT